MKSKCKNCGMIRSIKDLVKLENDTFICFSCWNKYLDGELKLNSK